MTTENTANVRSIAASVQAGVVNGGINVHAESAHSSIPYNLPSGTRRFVGGEAELRRLREPATAGSGSRVRVLDGPPGIGKTASAVWWGGAARELFPGGRVYVDLHGFDATHPAIGPRYHQRAENLYTRSGNFYGLAHVADSMEENHKAAASALVEAITRSA